MELYVSGSGHWTSLLDGHTAGIVTPPPPGTLPMVIGCSELLFDSIQTEVNNPTGSKAGGTNTGFKMRRTYESTGAGWPTSFGASKCQADVSKGVMSAWSITPSAAYVTAIAGGAHDSAIENFFDTWPSTHQGTVTLGHEPENNGYNQTDYRNAQARIYSIYSGSSVNKNNVKVGIILTANGYLTGQAPNYFPADKTKYDFVGIDYYEYWRPDSAPVDPNIGTHGAKHPTSWFVGAAINFALSKGKPVMIGEYGLHPDPAHPSDRPDRFQGSIDYFDNFENGCIAYCVYHSYLQPYHGPWWWDAFPNYADIHDNTNPDPSTLQKLRDVLSLHKTKWG